MWEGGSDLELLPPFPADPADWADPADPADWAENSKIGVFIVRVVILALDGALALCFSDFFKDASHKTPTFETILRHKTL